MIRKAMVIAVIQLQLWRRNAKVFFVFALGLVLAGLLTGKSMEFALAHESPVQLLEPFVWTFGDSGSVLLCSCLLLLLFSDAPFVNSATPFLLARADRKAWLLGQVFYVILSTVIYLLWILFCTVILCAKHAFAGNQWSRTAAILGYSKAGAQFYLPSSARTMEQTTPLGCAGLIFALLLGYSLSLSFLMLWLGLRGGGRAAFLGGLGFSVYGFLLRAETVQALLHLNPTESFQANVLLGWISPLNHATYPMHNFGYDRLPTLLVSILLYFGLLLVLLLCAAFAVRHYHFSFFGRQKSL